MHSRLRHPARKHIGPILTTQTWYACFIYFTYQTHLALQHGGVSLVVISKEFSDVAAFIWAIS